MSNDWTMEAAREIWRDADTFDLPTSEGVPKLARMIRKHAPSPEQIRNVYHVHVDSFGRPSIVCTATGKVAISDTGTKAMAELFVAAINERETANEQLNELVEAARFAIDPRHHSPCWSGGIDMEGVCANVCTCEWSARLRSALAPFEVQR